MHSYFSIKFEPSKALSYYKVIHPVTHTNRHFLLCQSTWNLTFTHSNSDECIGGSLGLSIPLKDTLTCRLEEPKVTIVQTFNHSWPWPMRAPVRASLALPKPSSLQTTLADSRFQRSSHTVPHTLLFSTSTRPSPTLAPPFSLTLV